MIEKKNKNNWGNIHQIAKAFGYIVLGIIILTIILGLFRGVSEDTNKPVVVVDYSIKKSTDFFLTGSDLSTEWQYGSIKTAELISKSGIAPLERYTQSSTLVRSGIFVDVIRIEVFKFNTENYAKSQYSNIINDIITARGYIEKDVGRDNCFTRQINTTVLGTDTTSYCYLGNYFVEISYFNHSGEDMSFFRSIVTLIHNK